MKVDTSSVKNLIYEFRHITDKDAVTPDNLGVLLERITGLIDEIPVYSGGGNPGGDTPLTETVSLSLSEITDIHDSIFNYL